MKFTDLFGKATSRWIRYSDYDAEQDDNGEWFILWWLIMRGEIA